MITPGTPGGKGTSIADADEGTAIIPTAAADAHTATPPSRRARVRPAPLTMIVSPQIQTQAPADLTPPRITRGRHDRYR
ncbi:hypothetical protein GCM10009801_46560 [Streptomyces albiaxialis]|uniref:Uncharacterized protein n=1 Tax=Streptomyces albiaxialis TaxID=329523 RepID=A0ABN2W787_9ACTN